MHLRYNDTKIKQMYYLCQLLCPADSYCCYPLGLYYHEGGAPQFSIVKACPLRTPGQFGQLEGEYCYMVLC